MALEDLTPSNRIEEILDGEDITPSNRLEYFLKQAAAPAESGLPEVTAADAGKVLTVDSEGAWAADDVPEELPKVTAADEGKVLTVSDAGAWEAGKIPIHYITNTSQFTGHASDFKAGDIVILSFDSDTERNGVYSAFNVSDSAMSLSPALHIVEEGSTTVTTLAFKAIRVSFSNGYISDWMTRYTIHGLKSVSNPKRKYLASYPNSANMWTWEDLPLPELPSDSADGTYTLKATMASGTVTYTWVLDS